VSVYSVLDQVWDTKNFNVGGGAAAAVAGAMAAGLVGMVARLSTGKDSELIDERYEEIAAEMDFLCQELQAGAKEDEKAFLGMRDAFRLPKSSDDDKAKRRAAIEEAAIVAAEVPLENARKAAKVLERCRELKGRSNSSAASDLEIGDMLCRVAIRSCALNIDANLPLVKAHGRAKPLQEASAELKVLVE
jgi:formiminotetrahydrofolate cyclodeaminase